VGNGELRESHQRYKKYAPENSADSYSTQKVLSLERGNGVSKWFPAMTKIIQEVGRKNQLSNDPNGKPGEERGSLYKLVIRYRQLVMARH